MAEITTDTFAAATPDTDYSTPASVAARVATATASVAGTTLTCSYAFSNGKRYRIVASIKNATASAVTFTPGFNGDSTSGNYRSNYLFYTTASGGGNAAGQIAINSASNYSAEIAMDLFVQSDGILCNFTMSCRRTAATADAKYITGMLHYTNLPATSFEIVANVADAIDAGSKITIFEVP